MAVERSMQVRLDMLVGDYVRNADKAGKATQGIAKAAESPKSALDRVSDAGRDVGRTLKTASGVGVAALAAWGVSAFAAGAAFNTLQQTAGQALITVLGSAGAASAQMEELVSWSKTSPFPRQLWIEAQQTLLGFGFEAEKIVPTLAAIQDGMVAVGGGEQQIREVVQVLAKVNSTGNVTAGTLNELAYRGIDAAALIGGAFGKTADQIRSEVSSGTIDAQMFLETLTDSLQERFAGAAEGLRTTWVGAFDRIKGATRDIGAILAEPFIDPAGGGAAVEWANDVADMMRALEAAMRPAMEVLRDRAEPAVQAVSEAMQRLAAAIREVDLVALVDRVADAGPVLAAFGAAAAAAGSASVLGAIGMGSLAAAISPVSAGLLTLAAVSPELRGALMDLATALTPLIPPLTDLAIELAEIATVAAGTLGSVLSALIPVLTGIAVAITPVIQAVGWFAEGVAAIPGPVLTAVAGLGALLIVIHQLRTLTGALAIGGAIVAGLDSVTGAAGRAKNAIAGAKLGLAGLAAGAVLIGLDMLISRLSDTAKELERVRSVNVGGLVDDLERMGRTGQVIGDLKNLFGEGTEGIDKFADSLKVATADWWSWSDSVNRSLNEMSAADERFEKLDQAMSQMVSSGHDADEIFESLTDTYGLNADQVDKLAGLLPQFTAAAERQAAAAGEAADGVDELTEAEAALEEQTNATISSLKELSEELRAQSDPVFAAVRAMGQLEEKQQAYNDALEEFGEGSAEANQAALEWLDAQIQATEAAGELADVTGGVLPHEMRLLAEEMGISAETVDWLEDQLTELMGTAEETSDSIRNANADIATSTGRMQVENALAYSGMGRDQAQMVTGMIARVDELIASGWSYEDAIQQVARESNTQTSVIEQGFQDAAAAGRDFSTDYPASITLTGADEAIGKLESVARAMHNVPSYKRVQIEYSQRGMNAPSGSLEFNARGAIVRSPTATWVAEAGHPESIISWDPAHRDRSVAIWEETGRALGTLASSTRFAAPAPPSAMSAPRSSSSGVSIENFNMQAVSERFELRQVQNELMYAGAS